MSQCHEGTSPDYHCKHEHEHEHEHAHKHDRYDVDTTQVDVDVDVDVNRGHSQLTSIPECDLNRISNFQFPISNFISIDCECNILLF
jgi:hypothetical protein